MEFARTESTATVALVPKASLAKDVKRMWMNVRTIHAKMAELAEIRLHLLPATVHLGFTVIFLNTFTN